MGMGVSEMRHFIKFGPGGGSRACVNILPFLTFLALGYVPFKYRRCSEMGNLISRVRICELNIALCAANV